MNEKECNLRIAESISAEFAWNGQMFREGDCVALLDGKVVAVADNPDEAISALRALDPDPKRGMVIEVAHPVVDVIR
jgi:urease accessory protein UreE